MPYLTRSFVITVFASYVFIILLLYASASHAYSTANPEAASQMQREIEAERQTLTASSIFLNNLKVSASLVIPFIGVIPFLTVWINTGQVIGLLSLAFGIHPATYVLNLTFLAFPEILAYTLLFAENIHLTALTILKAGAKTRLLTQSWKSLLIYIGLLFAAAVSEVILIGG